VLFLLLPHNLLHSPRPSLLLPRVLLSTLSELASPSRASPPTRHGKIYLNSTYFPGESAPSPSCSFLTGAPPFFSGTCFTHPPRLIVLLSCFDFVMIFFLPRPALFFPLFMILPLLTWWPPKVGFFLSRHLIVMSNDQGGPQVGLMVQNSHVKCSKKFLVDSSVVFSGLVSQSASKKPFLFNA